MQVIQGQFLRDAQHCFGLEQQFAAHGRRGHVGDQVFDVDALPGQQAGDVAHDAGAVVADQFHADQAGGIGRLDHALGQQHADAMS